MTHSVQGGPVLTLPGTTVTLSKEVRSRTPRPGVPTLPYTKPKQYLLLTPVNEMNEHEVSQNTDCLNSGSLHRCLSLPPLVFSLFYVYNKLFVNEIT